MDTSHYPSTILIPGKTMVGHLQLLRSAIPVEVICEPVAANNIDTRLCPVYLKEQHQSSCSVQEIDEKCFYTDVDLVLFDKGSAATG